MKKKKKFKILNLAELNFFSLFFYALGEKKTSKGDGVLNSNIDEEIIKV